MANSLTVMTFKIIKIVRRAGWRGEIYNCSTVAVLILTPACVVATPPLEYGTTPVTVADNLDEEDGFGYSVDTVGRGLDDR